MRDLTAAGFKVVGTTPSPITGSKGNTEMLALLAPI
jgi:predicted rRNA methylase YqxC with S4 and FtsJ domains